MRRVWKSSLHHTIKWYNRYMTRLFKSASKVVLLMSAATASVGLFTGHVPVDIWAPLVGMVFGYYFGTSEGASDPETQ